MIDPWAILLAWATIHGNGPIPEGLDCRPDITLAVRAIALREEWIAPAEETPTLGFARGLRLALAGTPRAHDLDRFPSEEWLDQEIRFGVLHIEWLESQYALSSPGSWRQQHVAEWLAEARLLVGLYRDVSYAHWYRRQSNHMGTLRDNLSSARRVMGAEKWQQGVLPPVVPLWRFQRLP